MRVYRRRGTTSAAPVGGGNARGERMQSESPVPYRVTDRRGKHRLRSAFDNAGPELAADEPPAPSPALPAPAAPPPTPTPPPPPAAPAPSRHVSAFATTRGRLAAAG